MTSPVLVTGVQKLARMPVVPVPAGFAVQPIDPDEVAARLAELTLGEPASRVPDLAGPQVTSWAGLLRGICGPAIGAAGLSRFGSQAPALFGLAVCCQHPGTPWAAGRGSSSLPRVWESTHEVPGDGRAGR
jgi:hypothetical protein